MKSFLFVFIGLFMPLAAHAQEAPDALASEALSFFNEDETP